MGTTRQTHGTPGRDMWTISTGLGIAAAGGHESAPIRWAWVSGDPAGIESEAGRQALSQRRSGGVISRERRAWGSGNPGTRQPAGGLGRATAAADISRDRRAWGLAASRLAALAAIPPNSHAVLQWLWRDITSGDFHAVGQTGNRNK